MQGILLANLKLAEASSVNGYLFCAASVQFPGYNYFVTEGGRQTLDSACANQVIADLFNFDPEMWMLSLLECTSVSEFEGMLFGGFADVRDILTRLTIVSGETSPAITGETVWIDLGGLVEDAGQAITASDRVLGLPSVSSSDIVTLAEYDAIIEFMKTKMEDARARRGLCISISDMMAAVNSVDSPELDSVIDILYQNLVVGLQMAKNAAPDSSRKFISYVMKHYLQKDKGVLKSE